MDSITTADSLFFATMPSAAQYDSLSGSALGRGIDRYAAGDYSGAAGEFRRTIALSPFSDNALKAFEYLANALVKNGKTSEAIKTYKQAIRVFPSADGMNLSLGNLLYSEGLYTEAVEQYKAAVRKNPNLSQNIYSLGQGYLAMDLNADAEVEFKRAVQLSPKDSGGYYALGQTYRKMGRFAEAQQELTRALSIDKDSAEAHFELGMVYAELQQADEAGSELDILSKQSSPLYTELLAKIYETSEPRIIAAYSAGLNLAAPAGTKLSAIDHSLTAPGASKNYTLTFVFDKQMDAASVRNTGNWSIGRSTGTRTGGLYNWGIKVPETEVRISSIPARVTYDPDSLTAKVTFSITQNNAGDGTIDLSHLVFKFMGSDDYGNTMDTAANEYNKISKIV